jgi:predicted transcriptional regulator
MQQQTIQFRVPEDLAVLLDELARLEDRSRSAVVRRMVSDALHGMQAPAAPQGEGNRER